MQSQHPDTKAMNINSKDTIGGLPALKARHIARIIRYWETFNQNDLAQLLFDLSRHAKYQKENPQGENRQQRKERLLNQAAETIPLLQDEGYILPVEQRNATQQWHTTPKMDTLANAHATKPIARETADKIICGLLKRTRQVKSDPRYVYKVSDIAIFGSYESTKQKLGDVDAIITLIPKVSTEMKQWREILQNKRHQAHREGRTIAHDYIKSLFWPAREVEIFLKGNSRHLSMHATHEKIGKNNLRTIYRDDSPPSTSLPYIMKILANTKTTDISRIVEWEIKRPLKKEAFVTIWPHRFDPSFPNSTEYTVGLEQSCNHPELVIYRQIDKYSMLLHHIAQSITEGKKYEGGNTYTLPAYRRQEKFSVSEITDPEEKKRLLAYDYYGKEYKLLEIQELPDAEDQRLQNKE